MVDALFSVIYGLQQIFSFLLLLLFIKADIPLTKALKNLILCVFETSNDRLQTGLFFVTYSIA
jgi:hypothetical protein